MTTPVRLAALSPVRPVRLHSPAAVAALADALRSEDRLLHELTTVLQNQRDAIAADDVDALDDSVFATHRVLLTLGEARKQRRAVNRLLGEEDDLSLAALSSVFSDAPPPAVRDAAAALADTARKLHREVDISRRVLRLAIDSGDQLVRVLCGVPETNPSYEPSRAPSPVGGVLLNRKV